jgi:hypothetical protein
MHEDDAGASRVDSLDPYWSADDSCGLLGDERRSLRACPVHIVGTDAVPGVSDGDLTGAVREDPREDRGERGEVIAEVTHEGFSFGLDTCRGGTGRRRAGEAKVRSCV